MHASYIHELPDWPNLRVDLERLAPLLARVHERRGALLEQVRQLEAKAAARAAAQVATWDAVASNRLEGEHLRPSVLSDAFRALIADWAQPVSPPVHFPPGRGVRVDLPGALPVLPLPLLPVRVLPGKVRSSPHAAGLSGWRELSAGRDPVESIVPDWRRIFESVRGDVRAGADLKEFDAVMQDVGAGVVAFDALMNSAEPITARRLMEWQAALFPGGRSDGQEIITGAWRETEMEVVSPRVSAWRAVHFVAPVPDRVPQEMNAFLAWVNDPPAQMDPLVVAAVAHLWLLTVHPFADGNGRVTRALTDLLLTRADGVGPSGVPRRVYSLSRVIASRKAAYERALKREQRGASMDVTAFVVWFLETLEVAVHDAQRALELTRARPAVLEAVVGVPPDVEVRARRALARVLGGFDKRGVLGFRGKLRVRQYALLAGLGGDLEQARVDLDALVRVGVLRVDDRPLVEVVGLREVGAARRRPVPVSWRVVVPDALEGLVEWKPEVFVLRPRLSWQVLWASLS